MPAGPCRERPRPRTFAAGEGPHLMSVAAYNSAQRTRSLVAVIAAALSVGIAVGAMVPLISLRLEAAGYSNTLIGINGAMFPIGLLAIGYWLPSILRFFGPLRAVYFGVGVT